MEPQVGQQAYTSELRLEVGRPGPAGPRPELADVGKLVRRGVRAVVGAARTGDRVTLSGLLLGHLGPAGAALDVVEKSWPGYEHVNVQAGLDTWLASRLTGTTVIQLTGNALHLIAQAPSRGSRRACEV